MRRRVRGRRAEGRLELDGKLGAQPLAGPQVHTALGLFQRLDIALVEEIDHAQMSVAQHRYPIP